MAARTRTVIVSTERQILATGNLGVASGNNAGDLLGATDAAGNILPRSMTHENRVEALLGLILEVLLNIRENESNPA